MSVQKDFKTSKGTVLPLLNLKGKPYLQVAHRLQWFEEENPHYDISSTFLKLDDNQAVVTTTVVIHEGEKVIRRAKATKSETSKGFPDFIEKAETGALGRCLAMLGYGTQFTADELDEGDRLADSPITPGTKVSTTNATVGATSVTTNVETVSTPTSFRTRTRRGTTNGATNGSANTGDDI